MKYIEKEEKKMNLKEILYAQIKRENSYLNEHEVGTEEYNASMKRLSDLEDKLADLEKTEAEAARKDKQMADEKKDRRVKNGIEIAKTTGSIALPVIGLVAITAFEKEASFTTALRGFVNCFLPRKL